MGSASTHFSAGCSYQSFEVGAAAPAFRHRSGHAGLVDDARSGFDAVNDDHSDPQHVQQGQIVDDIGDVSVR